MNGILPRMRYQLALVFLIASTLPVTAQTLVGTLPGDFSVNGNGGALYSIPIDVPPGTRAMQPSLSLLYNSQQHNGLLGVGWTLNGLSVISRCSQTIAQDGDTFNPGIHLSDDDRFCLDGQRLMVVNGAYGADGSEYKTERDSWSRITAQGRCGSPHNNRYGPCSFTVTTSQGRVLEYGTTADARIEASGQSVVLNWALNKITDRNGNYLTVTYQDDQPNGQYYPTQIDYTGNARMAGLTPNRQLRFVYESRTDPIVRYQAGSLQKITQRLASIDTYYDNQRVKRYALRYEYGASSHNSRLASVTVCARSDSYCFEPTTFQYTDSPRNTFDAVADISLGLPYGEGKLGYPTEFRYFPVDMEGDGKSDLLTLYRDPDNHGLTRAAIYGNLTSSPFTAKSIALVGTWVDRQRPDSPVYLTVDVNGDGQSDIVEIYKHPTREDALATVWLGQGGGFAQGRSGFYLGAWSSRTGPLARRYLAMDVDGDGFSDIVEIYPDANKTLATIWHARNGEFDLSTAGIYIGGWTPVNAPDARRYLPMDINGDGRMDLVEIFRSGTTASATFWISRGSTFTAREPMVLGAWADIGGHSEHRYLPMDVNGDGKHDLVEIYQGTTGTVATTWLSDGHRFQNVGTDAIGAWSDNNSSDARYYLPMDDNGDGLSDIIEIYPIYKNPNDTGTRKTRATIWLRLHDRFVITTSNISMGVWRSANYYNSRQYLPMDINGDGLADVVDLYEPVSNASAAIWRNSNTIPDLLTGITNGLGKQIRIAYQPLTNNQVYSKDLAADGEENDALNWRNVQKPLYVVEQHQILQSASACEPGHNPGNACWRFRHHYEEAVQDRYRGWLGFKRTIIEDIQHNTKTTTTHHLKFPLTGMIKSREVRDSNTGALLGKEEHQYCQNNPAYCARDANGVWKLFLDASLHHHYTEGTANFISAIHYSYKDAVSHNGRPISIHYDGDIGSLDNDDTLTTCIQYRQAKAASAWKTAYAVLIKRVPGHSNCAALATWNRGDLSLEKRDYDPAMNLTSTSHWVDQGLYNGHDASQSLPGLWVTVTREYDTYGNLTVTHYPNGGRSALTYNPDTHTQVTQQRISGGTTTLLTTFGYNYPQGVLMSSQDANNTQYERTFDAFGRIIEEYGTNPGGGLERLRTFRYEKTPRSPDEPWYSVRSRQKKDWASPEHSWLLTLEHSDALGRDQAHRAPGPGALHTMTDQPVFNAKGQVIHAGSAYFTDPPCIKLDSKQTCSTQSQIPVTDYTYDRHGRLNRVTFPTGASTAYAYQTNDKRRLTTTHNSPAATLATDATTTVKWQLIHNASGQVIEKTAPDGSSTYYRYDALGRLTHITDPLGQTRRLTYNSIGLLLSETQNETGTTDYRYDREGNLRAQRDDAGRTRIITYDSLSRPTQLSSSDGLSTQTTQYHYGNNAARYNAGRLVAIDTRVDNNATTSQMFFYGATGAVTEQRIAIDINGDHVLDSSHAETKTFLYVHNALGQITQTTYPDGSLLYTRYNETGNALLKTVSIQEPGSVEKSIAAIDHYHTNGRASQIRYGNGIQVDHGFDNIGRLVDSRAGSATNELLSATYRWNLANKLLSISHGSDASLNQRFQYSEVGRLQQATRGTGPAASTVTYRYDKAGNILSNGKWAYSYDTLNQRGHRLNEVTDNAEHIAYRYDSAGYLTEKTHSNSRWHYSYNGNGQLTRVTHTDTATNTTTTTNTFRYDHAGNRIVKIDYDPAGAVLRSTYYFAGLYEVVKNNDALNTKTYTKYIGTLASLSRSTDAATAGIQRTVEDWEGFHHGVQLASVFPGASWDEWGQLFTGIGLLLSHGTWISVATVGNVLWFIVALSILGCLLRAALKQASAETVMGRIRWRVLSSLVRLGWLPEQRAEQECAPAAQSESSGQRSHGLLSIGIVCICFLGTYVPPVFAALTPGSAGAGVPVSGTTLYYISDHLGSVALVTNEHGDDVSRVNYTPFGTIDPAHSRGTDHYRAKFTGKELDQRTGLHYMGVRYYDAHIGRFLTPDPAAQYHSPYLYGNDDPLSGVDPNGEFFITLVVLGVGVLLGGYMGGAAVNHSMNPGSWDFKSGKTWAGIAGGAAIGAATGGAGIALDSAGLGVGATMAGGALLGGADNAAFAAMGGDSWKGIGESFAVGAAMGGALSGLARGFRMAAFAEETGEAAKARAIARECNSFTAGSEIATEKGQKNIEDVIVGDKVWSYNEKTGAVELNSVLHLMNHVEDDDYIVVVVNDEEIETTTEHPFYVEGKGWVKAEALKTGDALRQKDGTFLKIERLTKRSDDVRVYNIEVENNHNYYVSSNAILVHNTNGCRAIRKKAGFTEEETRSSDIRKLTAEIEKAAKTPGMHTVYGNRNRYSKEIIEDLEGRFLEKFNKGDSETFTYDRVYPDGRVRNITEVLEPARVRTEYKKSTGEWKINFETGRRHVDYRGNEVRLKRAVYENNVHLIFKPI